MTTNLFLFCGGPAIDGRGRPKPLMQIREGRSLIVHFLHYLKKHRPTMPASITLLCDDGQQAAFEAELCDLSYPVPIRVQACGLHASTFEKFELALRTVQGDTAWVQFGYPDIFSLGEYIEPTKEALESCGGAHISAAALTSRFPRLVVDVYSNEIKGISNYSSPVPSNPLYVFGGDLWGGADALMGLAGQFRSQAKTASPSLEYDFFFWLINHKNICCVMLYGERIWVDSIRDIHHLLAKTDGLL